MGPSIQSASSSTSIGGSTGLALYLAHAPPRSLAQAPGRVGSRAHPHLRWLVIDSLLSASWALDDGLLLAAAAVIALALLLTRGHGRSGGEMIEDSASVRE